MAIDQKKGIYRPSPRGHYFQPAYHIYFRDCWRKLETFFQSKERLVHILNKPPLVAHRWSRSLRDRVVLVHTKFKRVDTPVPRGCEECGKVQLVQTNQQSHSIYQQLY